MTASPVSKKGVYVGLCLPVRTRAMRLASRPRTWPSASTTCQVRSTSAFFANVVVIPFVSFLGRTPVRTLRRFDKEGGQATEIAQTDNLVVAKDVVKGKRNHQSPAVLGIQKPRNRAYVSATRNGARKG